MNILSIVEDELITDASGVLTLKGHIDFPYSEGQRAEKYLERVLRNSSDLGSRSSELQSYITDWSSEYHLTAKRAQLFTGFTFDRSLKVLEVGCGCGSITRYLGETFDDVVAIEGSIRRARLAKLRTRDLPGVTIICSPFHKIKFSRKFDLIFCVGVYEYSGSFVDAHDPYDFVLGCFDELLTPSGTVVIAIENQFGLKYLSASPEDHLGVRFEGIEGYHSDLGKVRTFGRIELEDKLKRRFPVVKFYYPYPDYKIPDCVLTEDFLATTQAGELVAQMRSRDDGDGRTPLWDDAAVVLELSRNRILPFFANSFLVFAGKAAPTGVSFEQLGIIFSSERRIRFATKTRILKEHDNQIVVCKRPLTGPETVESGMLKLVGAESRWMTSCSLQTLVYLRCRSKQAELDAIFSPCRAWVSLLERSAITSNQEKVVGGEHIDSTWSNVYHESETYNIVDREWIWCRSIPLNVLVIRAIYCFLSKIESVSGLSASLDIRSGKALIRAIASVLDVNLRDLDFKRFIALESEFQYEVFGLRKRRHRIYLKWFLVDRTSLHAFRSAKRSLSRSVLRFFRKVSTLRG